MSIINQALKKAQRERLVHETRSMPHLTRLRPHRYSRPRFLMIGGLVVVLSAAAALLPRSTAPVRHQPLRPLDATPASTMTTASPDVSALPVRRRPASALAPPRSERPAWKTPAPTPTVASTASAGRRSRARELFNAAVGSQKSGQPQRALVLLQQAVKLNPDLKEAYNSLGNLLYQRHQYKQAVAMYQKALAIDPDYAKAHNNLGSTYLRLAMDDRAIEELHKALTADRTYGLAYYNLACVYARAGDSTTAVRYLQQAIAIEPQARAWARTDDDFGRIRTTPELRQLLGPS